MTEFWQIPVYENFSVELYTLYFPKELYAFLKEKELLRNPRDYVPKNVPLKDLDKYVGAFLTDIIFVKEVNERMLDLPFIYAVNEIDLAIVINAIKTWFRTIYKSEIGDRLFKDFKWKYQEFKVEYKKNSNTADPTDPTFVYSVLPNYIAYRLSGLKIHHKAYYSVGRKTEEKDTLRYYEGEYDFTLRRVASQSEGNLISFKPKELKYTDYKGNELTGYISYKYKLKVENIPFEKHCFLVVTPQLIRWVTKPIKTYSDKGFTAFFTLKDNMHYGDNEPTFIPLKVDKVDKEYSFELDRNYINLLKNTIMHDYIPDMRLLQDGPSHFLLDEDKFFLGIQQSTSVIGENNVNNGLGQRDRVFLTEELLKALNSIMVNGLDREYMRLKRGIVKGKGYENFYEYTKNPYTNVLEDSTVIEIYHRKNSEEQLRKTLLEEIVLDLELESIDRSFYRCRSNNKSVEVRFIDMSTWDDNVFYSKGSNKKEYLPILRIHLLLDRDVPLENQAIHHPGPQI